MQIVKRVRYRNYFIPAVLLIVFFIVSCAGTPVKPPLDKEKELQEDDGVRLSEEDFAEKPAVSEPEDLTERSESVSDEVIKQSRALKTDEEGEVEFVESDPPTGTFKDESYPLKESIDTAAGVSSGMTAGRPAASGLKAGFADDNKQYGYFINFLKEYENVEHLLLPIEERIILYAKDQDGKSIPNAIVKIYGTDILCSAKTAADGSFYFYPAEYAEDLSFYNVKIETAGQEKEIKIYRNGKRAIDVIFDRKRIIKDPIPLDIVFILDTTGSMGEEIQRLKKTIELIHMNLSSLSSKPIVRFGMVLYKDEYDEYVTKTVPLTDNLEKFQKELKTVSASGGGDTPEDLQSALKEAVKTMLWNKEGIRLAFIITDAPPHLDYGQNYTYVRAAKDAKRKAIKIFSVGTGGLDITGEYILRQISQYTSGKYIFLTYGEEEESEGGSPGSVSHHTGANFQTDKLEAIIIRFAKEELSYLTEHPLEDEEAYFEANKIEEEEKAETLKKLFDMALSQLADYSTCVITKDTHGAILPIIDSTGKYGLDAEYFTEQLIFTAYKSAPFKLVERKDIQKILEELKLQLSGVTEGKNVTELGNFLNAQVLVTGNLYRKGDSYDIFLKFLRVETGEVLSVTKAVVDNRLGLTEE